MTLNQLRYFCTASRCRSITKAAQELFVTQPTISIAIRDLEMEFQVTLFYRKGNQLILTAEGEKIYEKATYLLQYSNEMQREFLDIGRSRRAIRVGIPPLLSTLYFPELINAFQKRYPEAEVELDEYGSVRACEKVQDDELDLALINMEIFNIDKYNSMILRRDRLMFVVHPAHPLADKEKVTTEDLAEEKLIFFNGDSVQNQMMKIRFETFGLSPHVIMRSSQLYTTLSFVRQADCGCFLFESMLKLFPEFKAIPLEPELPADIGFVWKKGKYVSADVQHFIDFAKKYYKE